jgi:hypothetical protein
MSATSYGEYVPVVREPGKEFDLASLEAANDTPDRKAVNRRIELLLFYGRPEGDPGASARAAN